MYNEGGKELAVVDGGTDRVGSSGESVTLDHIDDTKVEATRVLDVRECIYCGTTNEGNVKYCTECRYDIDVGNRGYDKKRDGISQTFDASKTALITMLKFPPRQNFEIQLNEKILGMIHSFDSNFESYKEKTDTLLSHVTHPDACNDEGIGAEERVLLIEQLQGIRGMIMSGNKGGDKLGTKDNGDVLGKIQTLNQPYNKIGGFFTQLSNKIETQLISEGWNQHGEWLIKGTQGIYMYNKEHLYESTEIKKVDMVVEDVDIGTGWVTNITFPHTVSGYVKASDTQISIGGKSSQRYCQCGLYNGCGFCENEEVFVDI